MKNKVDVKLLDLLNTYARNGKPIEINFRELVSWIPYGERATHLIHSYPGKLLYHIPHFFLANDILSSPDEIILDPFCGSGTVLLEAILSGREGVGIDSNPLACLISRVKTTPIDLVKLRQSIILLKRRIPDIPPKTCLDVINIKYWFYPSTIEKLHCILEAINSTPDNNVKDFFLVCFSNFVRKVSLADPRISVPVKLKVDRFPKGHWLKKKALQRLEWLKNIDIIEEFFKVIETNFGRMSKLHNIFSGNSKVRIIQSDIRKFSSDNCIFKPKTEKINNNIQLIITSPPYVGSQKYIRATSINLGWTGLCKCEELRILDNLTIGREYFPKGAYGNQVITNIESADELLKSIRKINPLRAHIAGTYLLEIKKSLNEIYKLLKNYGYLVMVVGNNFVSGKKFNISEYIQTLAEEIGFCTLLKLIDTIHSRGLMTKRNKTANLITREWILVFQKKVIK